MKNQSDWGKVFGAGHVGRVGTLSGYIAVYSRTSKPAPEPGRCDAAWPYRERVPEGETRPDAEFGG